MRSGKDGMLDGVVMGAWRVFTRKQSAVYRQAAWGLQGIITAYFNTHSVLPVETQILAMEPVCRLVKQMELKRGGLFAEVWRGKR